MISVLSLVLTLLGGLVSALTKSKVPAEIIALVQGAIDNLAKVQSNLTTRHIVTARC